MIIRHWVTRRRLLLTSVQAGQIADYEFLSVR
jgi:hypothetical protein